MLPNLGDTSLGVIGKELNGIVLALEPLEQPQAARCLPQLLRRAVEACAESSTSSRQSMESQLRSAMAALPEAGRKAVYQIDKLARYKRMSRDLIKLAAGSSRKIFRNLTIEHIRSPEPRIPAGASEMCSVHAEIQLILHYETHSHHPRPRAIGCSKSACYLCDLFISRHGRYRISFAHRRLYPKWTIPNTRFSNLDHAESIREVVRGMTGEMERLVNLGRSSALCAPIESKACLPLSSGLSTEENGGENGAKEERVSAGSASSATLTLAWYDRSRSTLRLGDEHLPFSQELPITCGAVQLTLGTLTVFFDFQKAPGPSLSVMAVVDSGDMGIRTFCADTLPMGDDLSLFSDETGKVRFKMCLTRSPVFEITLIRRLLRTS